MAVTTSPNLLCDGTVINVNGQQNICAWYGGHINLEVNGIFGGATVDLQVCTKAPIDLTTLVDADWVSLKAFTANGNYEGNLNPCLMRANVSAASGTTSVRAIIFG